MLSEKNIGFIGSGNMGEALIGGLLNSKLSKPDHIYCSDVRTDRLDELKQRFNVHVHLDNQEVIRSADIIVYAVKPQIMAEVLKETAETLDESKLIISIAAGVPLAAIESLIKKDLRLIRAMPNVCVAVGVQKYVWVKSPLVFVYPKGPVLHQAECGIVLPHNICAKVDCKNDPGYDEQSDSY